jgi:glycosyltransferase involved in cell wall biosynthesis
MAVISIITINLNNKAGLQKTINSVFEQTYKNIEYIIIDGASTDGSVKLIEENRAKIKFWQSESDKGIYDAMNKGIAKASGDYLLFLNSGDVLADNKIIDEINTQLQTYDIVYGDLIAVNDKNEKEYHKSFSEMTLENLMISTLWHPCCFIKRELFNKYGLYNTEFKLAGDYEFFVRAILKFDKTGISNQQKNEVLMNEEREKAWKLNFSDILIDCFKESVNLQRSSEYKIGKLVTKFIP